MSKKRSVQHSGVRGGRRRVGRPRVHDIETQLGLIRYVEGERKRTGYSINKICKHGSFAQLISGSPESCPDGPDRATAFYEIRGGTLRRRYFAATFRVVNSGCSGGGWADSPDKCRAEPEWAIGWISLKAGKPIEIEQPG